MKAVFFKEPEERQLKGIAPAISLLKIYEGYAHGAALSKARVIECPEDPVLSKRETEMCINYAMRLVSEVCKIKCYVRGVNFFDIVKSHLLSEYHMIAKRFFYMNSLIKKERPQKIYVQSRHYGYGKIANAVAKKMHIACASLEPDSFGSAKRRVKSALARRMYLEKEAECRFRGFHKKGTGPPILFFSNIKSDTRAFEPVIRKARNETYLVCREEVDFLDAIDLKINARKEEENLGSITDTVSSFAAPRFLGIDTNTVAKERLTIALKSLKKISTLMNYMEGMLDAIKPAVVAVGYDKSVGGRAVVFLAKKRGAKTLEIPHGGADFYSTSLTEHAVDKVVAGGKIFAEVYRKFGTSRRQIEITGWPRYDEITAGSIKKGKGRNVLYASQHREFKFNVNVCKKLHEACANLNAQLHIKPHPSEWEELVDYYNTLDGVEVYAKALPIESLITESNVVITFFSTSALDAVVHRKPVIIINLSKEHHLGALFAERGAGIEVTNLSQLEGAIKKSMSRKFIRTFERRRRKFIRDFAYRLDGKSTERVLGVLEKLMPARIPSAYNSREGKQ